MISKTKIRRKAIVLGKRAFRYAKTHKMEMFQIGVMAAIMLLPDTSCFAQSISQEDSGFETISSPMEKLEGFMTGKGAKIAATIGASAGIGAWTLNIDNQIVKNALRLTTGAGALLSVRGLVQGVYGVLIP